MEMYTVSFFGHREVERTAEIERRLEKLLHDLIILALHGVVLEFLDED